jgi:hypothetical protein
MLRTRSTPVFSFQDDSDPRRRHDEGARAALSGRWWVARRRPAAMLEAKLIFLDRRGRTGLAKLETVSRNVSYKRI